jgi:hypothetical protein
VGEFHSRIEQAGEDQPPEERNAAARVETVFLRREKIRKQRCERGYQGNETRAFEVDSIA